MKAKILLFVVLFSSLFTNAQNEICQENEEKLGFMIRDKEFVKANALWKDIQGSCSKYSEKLYLLASQVYNYNLQTASTAEKEESAKQYIVLLDLYDKNFPDNKNSNYEKRALILYKNKVGTSTEIFFFLDKAFTKQQDVFNNPEALNLYFKLFFEQFKDSKFTISVDQVIEKHSEIIALVEANKIAFPQNEKEYNRVISSSTNLIATILTCDNITSYAIKNFESRKTNVKWLEATATTLSQKCKTAPIFETIALELNNISPSSRSNYFLGDYYLNSKREQQAIDYFSKAVDLAPQGLGKAKIATTLATLLFTTDKARAREFMLTAIANDSQNGKYYIFLANLYANSVSQCAASDVEKIAIYQLASTTVLKASVVEPRLKVTADMLSKEYLKQVIVDKSLKRKAIKINCWINETVQF